MHVCEACHGLCLPHLQLQHLLLNPCLCKCFVSASAYASALHLLCSAVAQAQLVVTCLFFLCIFEHSEDNMFHSLRFKQCALGVKSDILFKRCSTTLLWCNFIFLQHGSGAFFTCEDNILVTMFVYVCFALSCMCLVLRSKPTKELTTDLVSCSKCKCLPVGAEANSPLTSVLVLRASPCQVVYTATHHRL